MRLTERILAVSIFLSSIFVTVYVPTDSLVRRPQREPSQALVSSLSRHDGQGCPSVRN